MASGATIASMSAVAAEGNDLRLSYDIRQCCGGRDSNPSGLLIATKLLILQNSKNARIATSADLRYTAGTRDTNFLVAEVHGERRPLRMLRQGVNRQ